MKKWYRVIPKYSGGNLGGKVALPAYASYTADDFKAWFWAGHASPLQTIRGAWPNPRLGCKQLYPNTPQVWCQYDYFAAPYRVRASPILNRKYQTFEIIV